jgi:hypothetical protein
MAFISSLPVILAATVLVLGQTRDSSNRGDPPDPFGEAQRRSESDQPARCLREGTQVSNQLGYFRMTGDRVTFFSTDGRRRFVCLENLNLQRIARAIDENPGRMLWNVTGSVTEYRGANYLVVEYAILTAGNKTAGREPTGGGANPPNRW